eukprot:gb/GECH01010126.1/.p1 GENE.gb/GECH01010126.1/~~gb/GECH01010126.1/.p1  ORF type:complete len:543 (+),score=126.82 gb/GECH01010126.1/:1-1629(+)
MEPSPYSSPCSSASSSPSLPFSGFVKTPYLSSRKLKATFNSIDTEGQGYVYARDLLEELEKAGLKSSDARLSDFYSTLERKGGRNIKLDLEGFYDVIKNNSVLVCKALSGTLVIPDFTDFCSDLIHIMKDIQHYRGGQVADYIPYLAQVDPEQLGFAVCTVDGQQFGHGAFKTDFCVQSCSKPITYCLALEENGSDTVHSHIGREPSGARFNKLKLDNNNLPHNPMVNAGAIMACSLVARGQPIAERFETILRQWSKMAGNAKVGFNNSVFLSERDTADRNFCLGYMMREAGSFPQGTNLLETLEFYFQCCSLEMNCEKMSILAGTLANGGLCPTTGERALAPGTVRDCLSLMYSCGMYDYSGEWAFTIGVPAKSGVSGCIFVVIPNLMGLCLWSPRLDENGNSVRGIEFCKKLVERFNFHNYDNLVGVTDKNVGKIDPRRKTGSVRQEEVTALLYAAASGDLHELQRLFALGVDLDLADYDNRTALHLASAEGHLEVVEFLLNHNVKVNPKDRWKHTPNNDAQVQGHWEIVEILKQYGGTQ